MDGTEGWLEALYDLHKAACMITCCCGYRGLPIIDNDRGGWLCCASCGMI